MFYKSVRLILWVIFRVLFRFKRVGQENIPAEGPVIIVSNHASYLDPIVLSFVSPRPVFFMAKAELFEKPLLGGIITKLNAFPVHRDRVDLEAIKLALRILRKGGVLVLFPEGTRIRTGSLGEAEPGAARLAIRSGVPVVPVGIRGTLGAFPGKTIMASVGKVLLPPENEDARESVNKFSQEMMSAIALLAQVEKK